MAVSTSYLKAREQLGNTFDSSQQQDSKSQQKADFLSQEVLQRGPQSLSFQPLRSVYRFQVLSAPTPVQGFSRDVAVNQSDYSGSAHVASSLPPQLQAHPQAIQLRSAAIPVFAPLHLREIDFPYREVSQEHFSAFTKLMKTSYPIEFQNGQQRYTIHMSADEISTVLHAEAAKFGFKFLVTIGGSYCNQLLGFTTTVDEMNGENKNRDIDLFILAYPQRNNVQDFQKFNFYKILLSFIRKKCERAQISVAAAEMFFTANVKLHLEKDRKNPVYGYIGGFGDKFDLSIILKPEGPLNACVTDSYKTSLKIFCHPSQKKALLCSLRGDFFGDDQGIELALRDASQRTSTFFLDRFKSIHVIFHRIFGAINKGDVIQGEDAQRVIKGHVDVFNTLFTVYKNAPETLKIETSKLLEKLGDPVAKMAVFMNFMTALLQFENLQFDFLFDEFIHGWRDYFITHPKEVNPLKHLIDLGCSKSLETLQYPNKDHAQFREFIKNVHFVLFSYLCSLKMLNHPDIQFDRQNNWLFMKGISGFTSCLLPVDFFTLQRLPDLEVAWNNIGRQASSYFHEPQKTISLQDVFKGVSQSLASGGVILLSFEQMKDLIEGKFFLASPIDRKKKTTLPPPCLMELWQTITCLHRDVTISHLFEESRLQLLAISLGQTAQKVNKEFGPIYHELLQQLKSYILNIFEQIDLRLRAPFNLLSFDRLLNGFDFNFGQIKHYLINKLFVDSHFNDDVWNLLFFHQVKPLLLENHLIGMNQNQFESICKLLFVNFIPQEQILSRVDLALGSVLSKELIHFWFKVSQVSEQIVIEADHLEGFLQLFKEMNWLSFQDAANPHFLLANDCQKKMFEILSRISPKSITVDNCTLVLEQIKYLCFERSIEEKILWGLSKQKLSPAVNRAFKARLEKLRGEGELLKFHDSSDWPLNFLKSDLKLLFAADRQQSIQLCLDALKTPFSADWQSTHVYALLGKMQQIQAFEPAIYEEIYQILATQLPFQLTFHQENLILGLFVCLACVDKNFADIEPLQVLMLQEYLTKLKNFPDEDLLFQFLMTKIKKQLSKSNEKGKFNSLHLALSDRWTCHTLGGKQNYIKPMIEEAVQSLLKVEVETCSTNQKDFLLNIIGRLKFQDKAKVQAVLHALVRSIMEKSLVLTSSTYPTVYPVVETDFKQEAFSFLNIARENAPSDLLIIIVRKQLQLVRTGDLTKLLELPILPELLSEYTSLCTELLKKSFNSLDWRFRQADQLIRKMIDVQIFQPGHVSDLLKNYAESKHKMTREECINMLALMGDLYKQRSIDDYHYCLFLSQMYLIQESLVDLRSLFSSFVVSLPHIPKKTPPDLIILLRALNAFVLKVGNIEQVEWIFDQLKGNFHLHMPIAFSAMFTILKRRESFDTQAFVELIQLCEKAKEVHQEAIEWLIQKELQEWFSLQPPKQSCMDASLTPFVVKYLVEKNIEVDQYLFASDLDSIRLLVKHTDHLGVLSLLWTKFHETCLPIHLDGFDDLIDLIRQEIFSAIFQHFDEVQDLKPEEIILFTNNCLKIESEYGKLRSRLLIDYPKKMSTRTALYDWTLFMQRSDWEIQNKLAYVCLLYPNRQGEALSLVFENLFYSLNEELKKFSPEDPLLFEFFQKIMCQMNRSEVVLEPLLVQFFVEEIVTRVINAAYHGGKYTDSMSMLVQELNNSNFLNLNKIYGNPVINRIFPFWNSYSLKLESVKPKNFISTVVPLKFELNHDLFLFLIRLQEVYTGHFSNNFLRAFSDLESQFLILRSMNSLQPHAKSKQESAHATLQSMKWCKEVFSKLAWAYNMTSVADWRIEFLTPILESSADKDMSEVVEVAESYVPLHVIQKLSEKDVPRLSAFRSEFKTLMIQLLGIVENVCFDKEMFDTLMEVLKSIYQVVILIEDKHVAKKILSVAPKLIQSIIKNHFDLESEQSNFQNIESLFEVISDCSALVGINECYEEWMHLLQTLKPYHTVGSEQSDTREIIEGQAVLEETLTVDVLLLKVIEEASGVMDELDQCRWSLQKYQETPNDYSEISRSKIQHRFLEVLSWQTTLSWLIQKGPTSDISEAIQWIQSGQRGLPEGIQISYQPIVEKSIKYLIASLDVLNDPVVAKADGNMEQMVLSSLGTLLLHVYHQPDVLDIYFSIISHKLKTLKICNFYETMRIYYQSIKMIRQYLYAVLGVELRINKLSTPSSKGKNHSQKIMDSVDTVVKRAVCLHRERIYLKHLDEGVVSFNWEQDGQPTLKAFLQQLLSIVDRSFQKQLPYIRLMASSIMPEILNMLTNEFSLIERVLVAQGMANQLTQVKIVCEQFDQQYPKSSLFRMYMNKQIYKVLQKAESTFVKTTHQCRPIDIGRIQDLFVKSNQFFEWVWSLDHLSQSLEVPSDCIFFQEKLHVLLPQMKHIQSLLKKERLEETWDLANRRSDISSENFAEFSRIYLFIDKLVCEFDGKFEEKFQELITPLLGVEIEMNAAAAAPQS